MTTNRPLRVFLCHSKNDAKIVRDLYEKLRAEPWIDPWLDEEELFPGMDWNMEIEKAIEATDVILVCLSNNSITKEGYVQREIRIALDYADYKPEGTLFIIPVRLEECTPPKRLARWQYADFFEDQRERGILRLLVSLKKRFDDLGLMYGNKTVIDFEKNAEVKLMKLARSPQPPNLEPLFTLIQNPFENILTLFGRIEFMYVSADKFIMGDNGGKDGEKPQHFVDIPYDYWMAQFPTTNEFYNFYRIEKGIEHPPGDWWSKKDHPIVNIKRIDIIEFCGWLNNIFIDNLPSGLIVRLPTEAEWEKAARGIDGRRFPWGTVFDINRCNVNEIGTTPVGSFSPQGDSPYGCADMLGNVWEITHSLYYPYPYSVNDGRENKDASGYRVVRGGSFKTSAEDVYCARRPGYVGTPDWNDVGFRICIAPPLPK